MMSDDEYFNDETRVDELGRALAYANEVNAELRARLERVRLIAEADRLGLTTCGISRDDLFSALAGDPH